MALVFGYQITGKQLVANVGQYQMPSIMIKDRGSQLPSSKLT
jgi:hypothetical protein